MNKEKKVRAKDWVRGEGIHQPDPKVNRTDRRRILSKRVRNLERRHVTGQLAVKLANYRSELQARPS